MRIGAPEVRPTADAIEVRVPVEAARGPDALWFRVDAEHAACLSSTGDAPLVGLLVPAMAAGEDVAIDARVSTRLLHHLARPYQALLRHLIPSLRPVAVRAAGTVADRERAHGIAAGFSGGIDSFCTIADCTGPEVPAGCAVDRLVFSNVGAHGRGERATRLFAARYARTRAVADRLGLPLIRVDSNLDAFFDPPYDFLLTHPVRNAAVALLLQGGIARYLFSAATSFREVRVEPTDSLTYCDPIALPMLGTERLDLQSAGSEHTRIEKTLRVADLPVSWETLDVCTDPLRAGNCSACWKCLRTLLTLDIAGLVDRYAAVFDLPAYRRRRQRFMREVLAVDDPFYRDIVAFARERGFAFPPAVRARARLERLGRNLAGALGLVRRPGA